MGVSSLTKMVMGLVTLFLFSYTSTVNSQEVTGNNIIIALNNGSHTYQDFTVSPLP
jgi:hypothetical protein